MAMNSWLIVVLVLFWSPGRVRTQCASTAIYTLHHDLRVKWGNYKHHQVWKVSQFDTCKQHHFCLPSLEYLGERKKYLACGYGFYNLNRNSESADDCLPCPAGKYCHAGVFDCEPGYYCPENGLPKEPWPGYYAPNAGMTEPLECPAGTYQTVDQHIKWEWRGVTKCLQCNKRRYCDTTRLTEPAGICEDGWFCDSGESSPRPAGKQCPRGRNCISGERRSCLLGYYQPLEAMSFCFPCPEGMYCSNYAISDPTGVCSDGWYCDTGERAKQPSEKRCPAGYMCVTGLKSPCGKGYYQPGTGSITCLECPIGKYCSSSALTSPTGDCDPGCCMTTRQIKPNACPPGNPSSCPAGEYMDITDQTCYSCPEGKYCAVAGLWTPSWSCSPGWYCLTGEVSPSPVSKYCPAGYKCPEGIKEPCGLVGDVYYYQPKRGQTECIPCPSGFDCKQPALALARKICNPGYLCKNGRIQLCDVERYCINGVMKTCPKGFEQPNPGQGSCVRCAEGFVCVNGKRLPCPKNRVCYNGLAHYCELGYECTFVNGQNVKTPCAPGTERYELESTSCVPCRQFRYCRSASSYECFRYHEGLFCEGGEEKPFLKTSLPGEYYKLNEALRGYTRESCAPGTYSSNNHSNKCLPCPAGHFCVSGSTAPVPCPEGKTQPNTGQSSCI